MHEYNLLAVIGNSSCLASGLKRCRANLKQVASILTFHSKDLCEDIVYTEWIRDIN